MNYAETIAILGKVEERLECQESYSKWLNAKIDLIRNPDIYFCFRYFDTEIKIIRHKYRKTKANDFENIKTYKYGIQIQGWNWKRKESEQIKKKFKNDIKKYCDLDNIQQAVSWYDLAVKDFIAENIDKDNQNALFGFV